MPDVISHREWLEKDFIATVQQRGAAIIKARGLSSAASAANAVVDTVRRLTTPTPAGDWFSVAVCSDGSYGIEKGLIVQLPDPQRRHGLGDRPGRAAQRLQPRQDRRQHQRTEGGARAGERTDPEESGRRAAFGVRREAALWIGNCSEFGGR